MATLAREFFGFDSDGFADTKSISITPTAASSILVAVASGRGGDGYEEHSVTDDSGGDAWVRATGHNQEITDSGARHDVSVWFKRAGTTSEITVTFDINPSTDEVLGLTVLEFSTDSDDGWSFEAASWNDTGTGTASPVDTGDTVSIDAGDLLAIAVASWRTGSAASAPNSVGFDGSFADQWYDDSLFDNRFVHAGEWYHDTGGGTFGCEVSWSNTSDAEGAMGVVVFRLGSASAGASGTVAAALPPLAAALQGEQPYEGTLASALAMLEAALQGAQIFSGTVASALAPLATSLAAEQTQSGTAAMALPPLATALAGTHAQPGTASVTLAAIAASAAGTAEAPGEVVVTLPALATALAGEHSQAGTSSVVLTVLTASMAGSAGEPEGDVAAALPVLQAGLSGSHSQSGTAAVDLAPLATAIAGAHSQSGTAAAELPPVAAALAATHEQSGALDTQLPSLAVSVAGEVPYSASVDTQLPPLAVAVTGNLAYSATIATALPMLTVVLFESVQVRPMLVHGGRATASRPGAGKAGVRR